MCVREREEFQGWFHLLSNLDYLGPKGVRELIRNLNYKENAMQGNALSLALNRMI